jgi:hypothetical protein
MPVMLGVLQRAWSALWDFVVEWRGQRIHVYNIGRTFFSKSVAGKRARVEGPQPPYHNQPYKMRLHSVNRPTGSQIKGLMVK